MVSSVSIRISPCATAGSAGNAGLRRIQHVDVDQRRRTEAAALDEDRLLAEHLARLQHLTVGAEHRRAAEPELDELERHQPVVDRAELDALQLDQVDLDAPGGQPSSRLSTSCSGSWCWKKARVQQVHADDAQRLLLQRGFGVEHPDVDDDLAGLVPRMGLELHAHPAVAFVAARDSCGRPPCRRRRRRPCRRHARRPAARG